MDSKENCERSTDFTEWNFLEDLFPIQDWWDEDMAATGPIILSDAQLSFADEDLRLCMPAYHYHGVEWLWDSFSFGAQSSHNDNAIKLEDNGKQDDEVESELKVEELIQGVHCGRAYTGCLGTAELKMGADTHPLDSVVPRRARGKRCRLWASILLKHHPVQWSYSHPKSWSWADMNTPLAEEDGGRSCRHCLTKDTPQWRRGPMGPNTLCNACGVKFRKGILVPEYRPAKSPTFDASVHSNCNKKLLEMRAARPQDSCLG